MNDSSPMPPPLLSFCIPTYNRAGAVLQLVRRVLESPSAEIEIVVADNCSTDGTVAQLLTIDDSRLVVFQNEVNRGALYNQVNVLLQGRGIYSVLLLDKDSVDPKYIASFLEFLRREEPFTGYCEYHQPAGMPALLFQSGGEALLGMAYSCHHPSGYFFRKADLHDIRIVDRFSDHAMVGNFPFEFMQAELALRGSAGVFQEPVFVPESLEDARAIKSFTINGIKEDAFFLPKGRLNTAIQFSSHIFGLPLANDLKNRLVAGRFIQGLRGATLEYRSIMANEAICHHYHIASRHVGKLELMKITVDFCRGFVGQLNSVRPDSGHLTGFGVLFVTAIRLLQFVVKRLRQRLV